MCGRSNAAPGLVAIFGSPAKKNNKKHRVAFLENLTDARHQFSSFFKFIHFFLFLIHKNRPQGTFPLFGLPSACVCEERGNDPSLQVAQEAGRVAAARIHEVLAGRRLQRPLPRLPAQPQADALPLRQRRVRQGVHQHVGRADARQLPPKRLGHHPGRIPAVPRHRGLSNCPLRLQRTAHHPLPLPAAALQLHFQEQGRYGYDDALSCPVLIYLIPNPSSRETQELPHQRRAIGARRIQKVYEKRGLPIRQLPILPRLQSHPLHPRRMHLRPTLQRTTLLAQTEARASRRRIGLPFVFLFAFFNFPRLTSNFPIDGASTSNIAANTDSTGSGSNVPTSLPVITDDVQQSPMSLSTSDLSRLISDPSLTAFLYGRMPSLFNQLEMAHLQHRQRAEQEQRLLAEAAKHKPTVAPLPPRSPSPVMSEEDAFRLCLARIEAGKPCQPDCQIYPHEHYHCRSDGCVLTFK